MASNDIYELKVYQDYGLETRECLNVYYCIQVSVTGVASTLIDAYLAEVDPFIRAFQSAAMQTSYIECRNLFNVTDFEARDVSSLALVGDLAGEVLPVHDVVTFRFIRTTRDINNGYKRYSGITESSQDGGLITAPDVITDLEGARNALTGSWHGGTLELDVFHLVILKRIRHEPDEDHTRVWYTLPQTQEEAVYSDPAGALVNLFVRTQNTRRRQ